MLTLSLALGACGAASPAPQAGAPPATASSAPRAVLEAPAGGGGDWYFTGEADMSWDMPAAEAEELPESAPVPGAANMSRMIVTTFNLQAETTEFDSSVSFLNSAVNDFGGFVENSSIDGRRILHDDHRARSAFFSMRIPSGRIHEFVSLVGENTNLHGIAEFSDDITDSFFDNQARLAALVNQERLLSDLLEREDVDLEHILEVHREIAHVRHQIELINSAIQRMDLAVSFGTVHINLHEVMQYRPMEIMPTTFGQRVNQAMSGSWNNFVRSSQNTVINIIFALPSLIGFLIFVIVIIFIIKFFIRQSRKEPSARIWNRMKRSDKNLPKKDDDSKVS